MEGIFLIEKKKRNVAYEKKISELKKEDVRVKIVATVVEKDQSNFTILVDDGESNLRVLLDEENFNKVEIGEVIRIIGLVIPPLDEKGVIELKGEIVQDFSKLDHELYVKYLKLKDILFKKVKR